MKSLRCLSISLSQQCSLSWVCKAAVLGQFSVVIVSNEEPQMSPYISIQQCSLSWVCKVVVLGQFSVVVVSNEEPQMSPYISITAMFSILEERNWSTDTEKYTLSEEENNEDPSFNYYIGKDQKTKWKKALPPKNVRTRSENIITHLPGVKGEAKNAKSILDCWNLFIDDNILECIVTNTNIYIRNIQQNYSRERDANLTNLHEIKALLGIIYFLGVMKANKLNTDDAWARDSTGFELCRISLNIFELCRMSENRFRFLLRVIRFDDKATRNERLRQDKLAAVRLIFDTSVKIAKSIILLRNIHCVTLKMEHQEIVARKLCKFQGRRA
ncbi:hypothetical protein LAZ67_3001941 [Cordylochernes scorpioides]|uniref:PiggyBac transposable element-derived protein domain-containing protein n=1 Tax=Cordylochernes scorpioides TaxID=51811 RepID=A0ABY6K7I7_9ARAC|nr:hypothetical protein LAZ67_3001941 [Cordylochernes scorpioides]